MHIIICEIDHQSRFDAWDRVLRAGALGWSWGMGWGVRWERGSGWGIHVHPWLIHVNVWQKTLQYYKEIRFSLVTQSCLTLCNPMKPSTPGLPVHHQLPEFTQTHVHLAVMPFSHLIVCRPLLLLPPIPPSFRVFPISQFFAWGGQSTRVSASASVLPMNTQDWSPLGCTGWISLQSKGLSRVFSNTTVQKHQFLGAQLSSQSNSHIHTWPLEKP